MKEMSSWRGSAWPIPDALEQGSAFSASYYQVYILESMNIVLQEAKERERGSKNQT